MLRQLTRAEQPLNKSNKRGERQGVNSDELLANRRRNNRQNVGQCVKLFGDRTAAQAWVYIVPPATLSSFPSLSAYCHVVSLIATDQSTQVRQ